MLGHDTLGTGPFLISFSLRLQIADFGCARYFDRKTNAQALVSDTASSPMFWAPESIDPLRFGERDTGLDLEGEEEEEEDIAAAVKRETETETREKDVLDFSPDDDDAATAAALHRRRCYSAYTADLWALGVTLHCLYFLRFPFAVRPSSVEQQLREIVECAAPVLRVHPHIARRCGERDEGGDASLRRRSERESVLCDVIAGLLDREPAMRWSIENALDALGVPI